MNRFHLAAIAALLALCTDSVRANAGAPEPGSLLVFPCVDNSPGAQQLLTVTNTNGDTTPVGMLFAGTVDVEFVYVNGGNCQEFNRTRRLSPNDTLTVLASADSPSLRRGYAYAFAKSPTSGRAISFNRLIGTSRLLLGTGVAVDLEPWVFKAIAAEGAQTDVDADNLRDLNGIEYEAAPDKILVPRFFGQSAISESQLILINLSGAAQFTATVNFLVYNDNEDVFSAQTSFRCYLRQRLSDLSNVFLETFLESTNHNPAEQAFGALETGWFRIDGAFAASTAATINDPAILSALIEGVTANGVGAELPFVIGQQTNGSLLSHGIFP